MENEQKPYQLMLEAVKGKYFVDNEVGSSRDRPYEIVDIDFHCAGRESVTVWFIGKELYSRKMPLSYLLGRPATPEEVKRAKESQLAQKTQ